MGLWWVPGRCLDAISFPEPISGQQLFADSAFLVLITKACALKICVEPSAFPSIGLGWRAASHAEKLPGFSAEEAEFWWWSVTFSSQK